jgi:hypothetical protein
VYRGLAYDSLVKCRFQIIIGDFGKISLLLTAFPQNVDVLVGVRFLEKSRLGVEILFGIVSEAILDTRGLSMASGRGFGRG